MTELDELVKIRKLLQAMLKIQSMKFNKSDHDDKISEVKV